MDHHHLRFAAAGVLATLALTGCSQTGDSMQSFSPLASMASMATMGSPEASAEAAGRTLGDTVMAEMSESEAFEDACEVARANLVAAQSGDTQSHAAAAPTSRFARVRAAASGMGRTLSQAAPMAEMAGVGGAAQLNALNELNNDLAALEQAVAAACAG